MLSFNNNWHTANKKMMVTRNTVLDQNWPKIKMLCFSSKFGKQNKKSYTDM